MYPTMSDKSQLPKRSDFPHEAEFVIKEFDVPLVRIRGGGWFNWFGGTPKPYNASSLRVDNSWSATSFEEWVGIVAASMAVESGSGEA
jgi:hypothetical protein